MATTAQGMFYNLLDDAAKGGSDYVDNLAKVETEFQSGNRNLAEYILGTGYYGLANPIENAVSYVIPDSIEQKIAEGAQYAMDETGLSSALQKLPPDLLRAAGEILGIGGMLVPFRAVARHLNTDLVPERRAREASSADVIVDNFYDPTNVNFPGSQAGANALVNTNKTLNFISKNAEILQASGIDVTSLLAKVTAKIPDNLEDATNFYNKGAGLAVWASKGIGRGVQNMFNPKARARYKEFGVTPVAMEALKAFNETNKKIQDLESQGKSTGNLKKQLADEIEVATAQLQQMANIQVQAGAKPTGRNVPMEFATRASPPAAPMYKGIDELGKDWYENSGASFANQSPITKQESFFIQNHIERVWRNDGLTMPNAKVNVKAPRGKYSGDHFSSIAVNPNTTIVEKLFRGKPEGFADVNSLKAAMSKNKKLNLVGQDDTGVWMQYSSAGRAKVEGGMNFLIKVKPNGDLLAVASDLHDFGNKLPVINKLLEQALPNQVLGVTPPMQTNVRTISTLRSKANKEAKTQTKNLAEQEKITNEILDQSFGKTKTLPQPPKSPALDAKVMGMRTDRDVAASYLAQLETLDPTLAGQLRESILGAGAKAAFSQGAIQGEAE